MSAAAPFDGHVAEQASEWLVLLSSGEASEADRQAWMRWRHADPAHDRAWLHIESINERLRIVPARIARRTLVSPRSGSRRRLARTLPTLLLAGVAGLALYEVSEGRWSADYRTGVGERRRIALQDGTVVMLNTASAIDVRYDDRQRMTVLRSGEVWIGTAADVRPFRLQVGRVTLQALGTRFVVRRGESAYRLSVAEGAVRVALADGRTVIVDAGQQVRFTDSSIATPTRASASEAGWVEGVLVADRMRLDEFLQELQRHRRGFLRCDPSVAGLLVSGVMPLGDTDRTLQMLRDALPVEIVMHTRFWVKVVPR